MRKIISLIILLALFVQLFSFVFAQNTTGQIYDSVGEREAISSLINIALVISGVVALILGCLITKKMIKKKS